MYKILKMVVISILCITMLLSETANANFKQTNVEVEDTVPDAEVIFVNYVPDAEVKFVKKKKKPVVKKVERFSKADKELLALVTMAEAEGECERGQRLVIDTILNRVDSKHFPNTISGVIYQKNQFTSIWNGRIDKCYVKKDIYRLVEEEIKSRINKDIVYFTAGRYGNYGRPLFHVGNHYFSSYK